MMETSARSAATSALSGRTITRMNGAGNKILILDLRDSDIALSAREVRAIHRGNGLAFDQMMVLFAPRRPETAAYVRIYNNDGSQAGACGNGTRCVAWFLMREGARSPLVVETAAGQLECVKLGEFSFRVDMGEPRFGWRDIPLRDPVADTRRVDVGARAIDSRLGDAALLSMGNPHAIFFIDDLNAFDLPAIGPRLETLSIFAEKANISLARIEARDHLSLRVWERGVGITLACGSAACAAPVSAARLARMDRKTRVSLPGGDLTIEWRAGDNHVLMTGPVELEAEIRLTDTLFQNDGV
jgi:diaminopimelate epimerase